MALVPRENDHDGWSGGLALLPLQSFKTEHLHKVQLDRFTDFKNFHQSMSFSDYSGVDAAVRNERVSSIVAKIFW